MKTSASQTTAYEIGILDRIIISIAIFFGFAVRRGTVEVDSVQRNPHCSARCFRVRACGWGNTRAKRRVGTWLLL